MKYTVKTIAMGAALAGLLGGSSALAHDEHAWKAGKNDKAAHHAKDDSKEEAKSEGKKDEKKSSKHAGTHHGHAKHEGETEAQHAEHADKDHAKHDHAKHDHK